MRGSCLLPRDASAHGGARFRAGLGGWPPPLSLGACVGHAVTTFTRLPDRSITTPWPLTAGWHELVYVITVPLSRTSRTVPLWRSRPTVPLPQTTRTVPLSRTSRTVPQTTFITLPPVTLSRVVP